MFLPGYDEIVGVRDRILDDQRFNDSNRYVESPLELSNIIVLSLVPAKAGPCC